MLVHLTLGVGPRRVIVLHDWFSDRTSWDPVRPYLDTGAFTYVFADLRGYGGSRTIPGEYTADEAAGDVLALARHLGWTRYALVGHSMSTVVVQRAAQLAPDEVEKVVVVTPVPPTGLQAPPEALAQNRALALASEDAQIRALSTAWGDRLGPGWIRSKVQRWRAAADAKAVARYVDLWGATDISAGVTHVKAPLLAIAGAHDAPYFRADALEATLVPHYPGARVESISASGHYPMQETPPLLAAMIERFLR